MTTLILNYNALWFVYYDQNNLSLNIVPVYETILFSGVPEPQLRPIPDKPEYFKTVTLSLKNKKMLTKNLENYL